MLNQEFKPSRKITTADGTIMALFERVFTKTFDEFPVKTWAKPG